MSTGQKRKEWQKALEKVVRITDKLGMPVDKKIAETVAILYLFGFMTAGSCEGHSDRINEGPYVVLRSPEASALEKQLENITDSSSREYIELKNEIAKFNIAEQSKLFSTLKKFYSSHKPVSGRMLTLRTIGYNDFRLNCQGSELAYNENSRERRTRLALNRAEMKAFTEWLKKLYFSSESGQKEDLLANSLFVGKPTKESTAVVSELAEVLGQNTGIHVTFVYDGYFDGANGGPYIIFESPKAEEVRKSVVAAKGSLTSERRSELYKEAIKYNVADQQHLYHLLNDFYTQHNIDYERTLMIQTVGFSNFRLRHQGTEIALIETTKNRKSKLEANCDEMKAFTKYLKNLKK